MRSHALSALLEGDVRSVLRDPLLAWVITLPLAVALLLRVLLPAIEASLGARTGLDLSQYHPLIMSGFLLTAPGIVGMVVGFLLLDERDTRTLDAIRITPLSLDWYLMYRVALPLLLGTATTLIGYPVVGLVPLPPRDLLALAGLAGLSAPLITLVLATAAPNKVAGLALVKVVNAANLLPVAAFFVPMPWQAIAAVVPSYWPMRALWSAATGAAFGWILVGGLAVNAVFLFTLARLLSSRLRG